MSGRLVQPTKRASHVQAEALLLAAHVQVSMCAISTFAEQIREVLSWEVIPWATVGAAIGRFPATMVSVTRSASESFTVEVWSIVLVDVLSRTRHGHAPILLIAALVEVCVGAKLVAATQELSFGFVKKVSRANN